MITNSKKLSKALRLDPKKLAVDDAAFKDFPVLAPDSFVARMQPNNPNDPLLLQVLPVKQEFDLVRGFNIDPLVEKQYSPVPGLIHKFHGRVLLLVTNVCAINCRFCFRRYVRDQVVDWDQVFAYIKNDPTITEVILSGGDPFMLAPAKLQAIMEQLATIPHIARLRIHSRVPIVMPERVTAEMLQSKLPLVLVVHCNHPNEINEAVIQALNLVHRHNIPIFNQSVLLHKVNDDSETLIKLNEKLFSAGVIPYYLHLLDKVKGAAHFYVSLPKAKKIYAAMRQKLPGYLVPKLIMAVKNKKKYVCD